MGDSLAAATVHDAYLGLGANLGDRLANLQNACARLERAAVRIVSRSGVYETDAVADEPQPPYLNAAVRVQTALSAAELLRVALEIEREMGRQRPAERRWAPRIIDIDILLYDDCVMADGGLVLPHPRLLERPFVRVPLAQVAQPGLRHPGTGAALDHAPTHAGVRLWPQAL